VDSAHVKIALTITDQDWTVQRQLIQNLAPSDPSQNVYKEFVVIVKRERCKKEKKI